MLGRQASPQFSDERAGQLQWSAQTDGVHLIGGHERFPSLDEAIDPLSLCRRQVIAQFQFVAAGERQVVRLAVVLQLVAERHGRCGPKLSLCWPAFVGMYREVNV